MPLFGLRTQTPQQISKVPAAALTAFAGTEDRLRVLAAGYQLHIAKSVDPLEVVEAITSPRLRHSGEAQSGRTSVTSPCRGPTP